MVGHGGSSAGSYLADPTSPIPSHCASIVATSTLRVNKEANELHIRTIPFTSLEIPDRTVCWTINAGALSNMYHDVIGNSIRWSENYGMFGLEAMACMHYM